jgi:predicted Zn-dependent protease
MLLEVAMELVPSERAVLKIIRMLLIEASSRTHRATVLRSRWPALHSEAYSGGYASLVRKGLIAVSADGQEFSVTNAGLRAMTGMP